jgi:hypothetical protein
MRLGLAILLTVTQFAAPWLCCCGPLRAVMARHTAEKPPAPPADDGCCPRCVKHPPAPQPEKHERPPGGCPDRCPLAVMAVAVPADKPELPAFDALLVPVAVEPTRPLAVVSDSLRQTCRLRELPLLTAEDRLYAHHVLRC